LSFHQESGRTFNFTQRGALQNGSLDNLMTEFITVGAPTIHDHHRHVGRDGPVRGGPQSRCHGEIGDQ
jgi:hypothetical protein